MSEILKKLSQLVESSDYELAGAAIKIAGALKLKSPAIIKGIKKHIENENPRLKLAAIDGLGKIGSRDSISTLFPIYKNDPNLRIQAGAALAQAGDSVLPALEKEYEKEGSQRDYKKSILTVIASVKTKSSLKLLLASLADEDLEILKHICYEFRGQIEKMDPKGKEFLGKTVNEMLKRPSVKKSNQTLVSLAIILGFLADKKSKRVLLGFLDKKHPFVLRRNALVSLGRLGLEGKGHEDLAEALFPIIEEPDFAGYQRTIVETLEKLAFPKALLKEMIRYAESKSPDVRKFALSKMSGLETKENVQLLVQNLYHTDYQVRQSAEEALKKMPSVVPILLNSLRKEESGDRINRIAGILAFHRGDVTPLRLKEIFAKLLDAAGKMDDVKSQAYLNLLKQINPDFTHQTFMKEAMGLKKKKKFLEEIKLLELLSTSHVFTKEAKWELAMASLKTSAKDLSSAARNNDRVLVLVQGMIKSQDKDLVKRFFKEKVLTPQDIYYLGFHFSEKLFELKQFGIDLLKVLIKKSPRNQYAIQAKKRLQVVGTSSAILDRTTSISS